MGVELMLASVAVVVSLAGLGFVAYQTRMTRTTSEVALNLAVMQQLDAVLLRIAEDSDVHALIWDPEGEVDQTMGVAHVLAISLIDAVEMSLMACVRVPGFSQNENDWTLYATTILRDSGPVRRELESDEAKDFWHHFWDHKQSLDRKASDCRRVEPRLEPRIAGS